MYGILAAHLQRNSMLSISIFINHSLDSSPTAFGKMYCKSFSGEILLTTIFRPCMQPTRMTAFYMCHFFFMSSSRVNTFRRLDLLELFLEHYKKCENVKQIQVVWSDQESKPPIGMVDKYPKDKVIFEVHRNDSLNNRFRNLVSIPTEVSYSILLYPIVSFF